MDRVRKVTEELIGGEQRSFISGRGYVEQIFALIQIWESARDQMEGFTRMWVL